MELKLDSFSFSTFWSEFKFPLLNSKGEDAILFLNLQYITNCMGTIMPGTLGNAKTREDRGIAVRETCC